MARIGESPPMSADEETVDERALRVEYYTEKRLMYTDDSSYAMQHDDYAVDHADIL